VDHAYVPETQTWRKSEGGIWVEDHSSLWEIGKHCERNAQAILARPDLTRDEIARAKALFSTGAAEAVRRYIREHPSIVTPKAEFDRHAILMALPGGGYIDGDNVIHPADPSLMFTRCAGVRPAFGADPTLWIGLLMSPANGDRDVFEFLRRLIGYRATGTGWEQLFIFLHGDEGGEGKSTVLEILASALGTLSRTIERDVYMRKNYSDRFSTSSLEHIWFAYVDEINKGEEWAEAKIKRDTGGGHINVEAKFRHAREMRLQFALWFCGNHLPRFRDADGAIRRRAGIIECRTPLPKDLQRKGYAEDLFKAEGPAILAWILEARR
jgi:putative DNA primase/helicase